MKTYPVNIRMADGTQRTEICETYSPDQVDLVYRLQNNPQVVQIETLRIKSGVEQRIRLLQIDPVTGLWIG